MSISVVAKDNQTGILSFMLPMRYSSADLIIRGLEMVREDLHAEMRKYMNVSEDESVGEITDKENYRIAENQYVEAGKLLNLFTDAR